MQLSETCKCRTIMKSLYFIVLKLSLYWWTSSVNSGSLSWKHCKCPVIWSWTVISTPSSWVESWVPWSDHRPRRRQRSYCHPVHVMVLHACHLSKSVGLTRLISPVITVTVSLVPPSNLPSLPALRSLQPAAYLPHVACLSSSIRSFIQSHTRRALTGLTRTPPTDWPTTNCCMPSGE